MESEEQDGSEVQKTPEEAGGETVPETPSAEVIAELQEKAKVSSQNFERAKKAEAELKELRDKVPSQEFSPKDYLALTEAKVSSEDFDEVVRVSKILAKPLNETLKDKTMQSILKERADERRTAESTQTGGGRRGVSQSTPEALMEEAQRGNVPERDEDISKLVKAKIGIK